MTWTWHTVVPDLSPWKDSGCKLQKLHMLQSTIILTLLNWEKQKSVQRIQSWFHGGSYDHGLEPGLVKRDLKE